jgi:hypothetical protein
MEKRVLKKEVFTMTNSQKAFINAQKAKKAQKARTQEVNQISKTLDTRQAKFNHKKCGFSSNTPYKGGLPQ